MLAFFIVGAYRREKCPQCPVLHRETGGPEFYSPSPSSALLSTAATARPGSGGVRKCFMVNLEWG